MLFDDDKRGRSGLWDDYDDYPEDHSPYCHKSCDHPCHDAYDKMKERENQDVPRR